MAQKITVSAVDILREAASLVLRGKSQSVKSSTYLAAKALIGEEGFVPSFMDAWGAVRLVYGLDTDFATYRRGHNGGTWLDVGDRQVMGMMLLFTAAVFEFPGTPPVKDRPRFPPASNRLQ